MSKKRNSLNKKEIATIIARKTAKLNRFDVLYIIDFFMSEIVQQFRDGNSIELRGFGTFYPYYKKPRSYRIPKSKDQMETKGRLTLKFKPSRQILLYEEK